MPEPPDAVRAALIVAPFWGEPAHVGAYRVDRFIRWLRSVGIHVTVVNAGPADARITEPWGDVVTVADPVHAVALPQQRAPSASTAASRLLQARRVVVNALSPPDGKARWARRVAAHPEVRALARRADWIISTSPPESSHLASVALAAEANATLVVDMRDGWLDEPLKWLLQHSRVQRWREGRMERRVVERADRIFVVSDVLGRLLAGRIPWASTRTAVLTNAGPPVAIDIPEPAPRAAGAPLELLYAGRFTGSNRRQKPSLLLGPLAKGLGARPGTTGDVRLLGAYEHEDVAAIERARAELGPLGWSVDVKPPVARDAAIAAMARADGLLLLAMGEGVLTTKLFEYLATGRPILAVTVEGGALWRIGERLPQVFLVAAGSVERDLGNVAAFLDACERGERFAPPAEFSEEALRDVFLQHIGAVPDAGAAV